MLGENSLDQLRLGLDALQRIAERPSIKERELADLGAEFEELAEQVTKLNNKFKARIKSNLLMEDRTIMEGAQHIAILSKNTNSVLLVDKVKAFLGAKLPQFSNDEVEIYLAYKTKG